MAGTFSAPFAVAIPIFTLNAEEKMASSSLKRMKKRDQSQILGRPIRPQLPSTIFISKDRFRRTAIVNSSSVGSAEFVSEPATNVRFSTMVSVPGCSNSLILLGTGYREKVFAIIGVKVYAAGLYMSPSIAERLSAWKGRSAAAIQEDSLLFDSIFEAPLEKSLMIVLVRDVDGKTFWDALDDAISPRIKSPSSADLSALSTFRNTFQGRPLKQGTIILLTWLEPSKMLVLIKSNGSEYSAEAVIESINVSSSLFDVFLGDAPVSPPLKASVARGLANILK